MSPPHVELPANVSIKTDKYGGIYTKTDAFNPGFCSYIFLDGGETREVKKPYFTVAGNGNLENFIFYLTITSDNRTADIWYKNGVFWKFSADQLAHKYRHKLEQEYINNKVIYDEMARQFWQQCQLMVIVSPISNFEPFPDDASDVLVQELAEEAEEELAEKPEEIEEVEAEIVKNLDNHSGQFSPVIKNKSGGGTIIYVSKKHLPIEIVVVDSDAKLKVFRK